MDYGSLANLVFALTTGAVAALAWLFKLHGDVRVLRERLDGEVELRKALAARLDGFEQRIYQTLERIEDKLDGKANRNE